MVGEIAAYAAPTGIGALGSGACLPSLCRLGLPDFAAVFGGAHHGGVGFALERLLERGQVR